MTDPFTFSTLLDDAALLSFEHQLHLRAVLGAHEWSVDLLHPRLEFTGEHPVRCTAFHLLGTATPATGTWTWAWADPAGFAPELVAASVTLREFGAEFHISELAEAEVPFGELPGSPTDPARVVAVVSEAAKVVSGHWTSYAGAAGGGRLAVFLIEHRDFVLPSPDPTLVMQVIEQGIAEQPLTDHRRALYSYAMRRPLTAEAAPDWSQVRLTAPGLDLRVSFRGMRVASIDGPLSGRRR